MSKTPKPPVSRQALSTLNLLWQRTRIVSYPSSGRTWLRVMLAELGAKPRFTHAHSRLRSGSTPENVASDISEHYHRRVLFLLRDPRDTLASNYNHVTKGHNWKGDFKTFIRMPRYGLERMLTYHTAWLGARNKFKRGFRVETYEDLRADTAPTLKRIVDFLGVPGVAMEEVEASAARNQFEKMQQRESSGELKAKLCGPVQRAAIRMTPWGAGYGAARSAVMPRTWMPRISPIAMHCLRSLTMRQLLPKPCDSRIRPHKLPLQPNCYITVIAPL